MLTNVKLGSIILACCFTTMRGKVLTLIAELDLTVPDCVFFAAYIIATDMIHCVVIQYHERWGGLRDGCPCLTVQNHWGQIVNFGFFAQDYFNNY